jgi:hypothetical protein
VENVEKENEERGKYRKEKCRRERNPRGNKLIS